MRLTFKKIKTNDGVTAQVHPIDAVTGEEVEDVKSCSVDSIYDGLSTMTLTVNLREDKQSTSFLSIEWPKNEKIKEDRAIPHRGD